jgi:hypothetical protein
MKKGVLIIILFSSFTYSQSKYSELNSMPGAFSRLGFGARGMAMGNALSAVTTGDLVSYYNPANSVFQDGYSFGSSVSILSLDRSLNFASFTKRFGEPVGGPNDKFTQAAGICIGVIGSGVSNIEQRDEEGTKYGEISTSENQFFLAVSNHFSRRLSLGVAFKLYYYKMQEYLTTTSLGVDLGLIYIVNNDCTVSFVITDLISKYKWDSTNIYGTDGQTTEDKFPILKKIGIAYKFFNSKLLAAAEFEGSNGSTNTLRFGAEYNLFENLYLRAGLDRWVLNNSDIPARPSFGFAYNYKLTSFAVAINYAYIVEPYSPWNAHIIGVNLNF